MKFSQVLHFNAVPDWLEGYVAYDHIKKLIFQLERDRVNAVNRNDVEHASNTRPHQDNRAVFIQAVHQELEKVLAFYDQKEEELKRMLEDVEASIDSCPQDPYPDLSPPLPSANTSTHDLSDIDEKKLSVHKSIGDISRLSVESKLSKLSLHSNCDHEPDVYVEHLMDLRKQIISLYISLSELQSFVELNRTAFNKILKKYDKVLEDNIRQQFFNDHVKTCHPFTVQAMQLLQNRIKRVEKIYADLFARGQVNLAIQQMRVHLRDQVTYKRNTVWKDMVNQELRMRDAHIKEAAPVKSYQIPFSKHHVPASQVHSLIALLASLTVFIIFLNINIFGATHENHCFALLVFASMMWATEAIPLYATSLLIPFLIVPLGILQTEDGRPLSAASASKAVFASMFNSTIMMLLGGFAIAGALSKYGIAKAFASRVLAHAGTRPRWVLLAVMFVSAFLSMWISNVATPVLCFSLIDPILRTLDDNSPVAPCLLLGIALASCIGGLTSPISSPQNIITLQYMNPNPGWGVWFAVALPIAILSVLAAWCLLLTVYRPGRACAHLNTIKPTRGTVSSRQIFVLLISTSTIVLWCLESTIEDYIGSTGIIAAIPLFMFFGTRILGKEDLHSFLWSVVVLAQGGMALGFAVTSSGLLQDIAVHIKTGIEGMNAFSILCIFSILLLVFSTFVSHTVAALILIPIVQQVGQHLPQPHPNLLVMGAGLACSAGMGLPVSGFPNMSAAMLEDARGKQYLTTKDFIVTGIPTSIVCTILLFTLGYAIMTLMGF